MTRQARHRPPPGGRPAHAFSLAEMMIALIILGFGLLVVGAALPVGYTYTQRTVDRSTGDAAVEYALDTIEQRIRLCRNPLYYDVDLGTISFRHYTDVFRPRIWNPMSLPTHGTLARDPQYPDRLWEPIVKVRPLLARSIDVTPGSTFGTELGYQVIQATVEERIADWYAAVFGTLSPDVNRREYDDYNSTQMWVASSLPSISNVYPPIGDAYEDTAENYGYTFRDFLTGNQNDMYQRWPVNGASGTGSEIERALDRQIGWVAFYRRVSYAEGSDPNLYEFIVVATRLPSDAHRYAMFNAKVGYDTTGTASSRPRFRYRGSDPAPYGGLDVSVPVPWLVGFKGLPALPNFLISGGDGDRIVDPNWVDPPTLRFEAAPKVAALMPPGSILIPATNDEAPSLLKGQPSSIPGPVRTSGFVPHAPQILPIYEVERTEEVNSSTTAVFVKNNGFYPWTVLGTSGEAAAKLWPVWVIPPAFKEVTSSGQPVYERRSPVVAIGRRFIHLREVP